MNQEARQETKSTKKKSSEEKAPTFGSIPSKTYFRFANQTQYTCIRLNDGKYITIHDGQMYPTEKDMKIADNREVIVLG